MKTSLLFVLLLATALLSACSVTPPGSEHSPPTGRGDPNGGTVSSGTALRSGPGVGYSSAGF